MVDTDSISRNQLNQWHQEMASFQTISSSYCLQGESIGLTASRKVQLAKRTKMTSTSLQCTECDKTFNRNEILLIHNRGHNGNRPYKCDKCGKSFILKSALLKHSRGHR